MTENSFISSDHNNFLALRLEEANRFTTKALEKYGSLIKSVVLFGSIARGDATPDSDADIFLIIDDTGQEISREKLEEIDEDLSKIAEEVSEKISIHPSYTLTEFIEYARTGEPIIYNQIKYGKPLYDTGFFTPWKKLLESGKIPKTWESTEKLIEESFKKLARAYAVRLLILQEDCYNAMVDSTQAILMLMDLDPVPPNKLYETTKMILVEKGFLEDEYAEWLKEIIELKKQSITAQSLKVNIDIWIERTEKYLEKMSQLKDDFKILKKYLILEHTYTQLLKIVTIELTRLHGLPPDMQQEELEKALGTNIKEAFKRDFIDTGKIKPHYIDLWNTLENLKKEAIDCRKITMLENIDVEKLREETRKLLHDLEKTLKKEKQANKN